MVQWSNHSCAQPVLHLVVHFQLDIDFIKCSICINLVLTFSFLVSEVLASYLRQKANRTTASLAFTRLPMLADMAVCVT